MSDTGNKLILTFSHNIDSDHVMLYRSEKRQGNALNQIGQVMDELITEAVKTRVAELEKENIALRGIIANLLGENP